MMSIRTSHLKKTSSFRSIIRSQMASARLGLALKVSSKKKTTRIP